MNASRKFSFFIALAMLLALVLPLTAQDDVELRFMWYNDGTESEVMRDLLDRFEEETGITVVLDVVPYNTILEQLPVNVAAGEGPDLVRTTTTPTMAGFYLDLRPLLEDPEYFEAQFNAAALAAMRGPDDPGDGLYGFPNQFTVTGPYINRTLFEEAGIEPPTTFEEFTEAAIALTDPDNGRYGFGMRGGAGGQGFIPLIFEAFGSPIIDENGQPAMDFDKAVEGLRWYTDLHTVHGAVPPSVVNDSFRQIMEGFQTGQTAMLWHHTGSLAEMRTVLGDDGVFMTAPRPTGADSLIARATPSYNGISMPAPEDEEAAWEWVKYWAEVDTQVTFLEETGYFPTSALVADDERVQANPLYAAALATVNEVGPPTTFPGSPGWEQTVVLPSFQRTLLGEITPEEAVELMMEGLEEAING